jgi:hypothetical protein
MSANGPPAVEVEYLADVQPVRRYLVGPLGLNTDARAKAKYLRRSMVDWLSSGPGGGGVVNWT